MYKEHLCRELNQGWQIRTSDGELACVGTSNGTVSEYFSMMWLRFCRNDSSSFTPSATSLSYKALTDAGSFRASNIKNAILFSRCKISISVNCRSWSLETFRVEDKDGYKNEIFSLLRFSQTCKFWSSKANWRLRSSLPSIILTDLLENNKDINIAKSLLVQTKRSIIERTRILLVLTTWKLQVLLHSYTNTQCLNRTRKIANTS